MAQGYILTKGAVQTFLNEVKQILDDKNNELRIIERNDKPKGYNTSDCMSFHFAEYKITKFPYK